MPSIIALALAGLALLVIPPPAQATQQPACGDVLTPEQRPAGFVTEPQSRGRLAGELNFDPRLRREPKLLAAIRGTTAAERRKLQAFAKARDREDGRLCWVRTATITASHPRIASVLVEDATAVENLGRVELNRSSLLWDRAARRALSLPDLIDIGRDGPAVEAIVARIEAELVREKQDRGMDADRIGLTSFVDHIRKELGTSRATVVLTPDEKDPSRMVGLTFHYDSGELGSRMEHTYELFVPIAIFADRIKPAWRPIFQLTAEAAR